jgi:hypothetical protein
MVIISSLTDRLVRIIILNSNTSTGEIRKLYLRATRPILKAHAAPATPTLRFTTLTRSTLPTISNKIKHLPRQKHITIGLKRGPVLHMMMI